MLKPKIKILKSVKYKTTNAFPKNISFDTKEKLLKYIEDNNIIPVNNDEFLKFKEIITYEYDIPVTNNDLSITVKQQLFNLMNDSLFNSETGFVKDISFNKYSNFNRSCNYLNDFIYWYINKVRYFKNIDPFFADSLIELCCKKRNLSSSEIINEIKKCNYNVNFFLSNLDILKFIFNFIIDNNKYNDIKFYMGRYNNIHFSYNNFDILFHCKSGKLIPLWKYENFPELKSYINDYDGDRSKLTESHLKKLNLI
jgi:hypothetical protein